ncbi:hypothetical protein L2E82_17433 [Cichorium intybus]|uniref:Uncharacterized protein n=1 Tax=Cichorium intybus TaxID=13427 RepID=A0ACB9F8W8_CICIN|nr:hypothetical protein L2E82_17433 [Cichorium intybus]
MVAIKNIEVDLLQLRAAAAAYSWSIMLISTLYVFIETEKWRKIARSLLDWKWDDVDDPTDVGFPLEPELVYSKDSSPSHSKRARVIVSNKNRVVRICNDSDEFV